MNDSDFSSKNTSVSKIEPLAFVLPWQQSLKDVNVQLFTEDGSGNDAFKVSHFCVYVL